MSEQQNGFSRMNNVNHSGGSNRSTSGPARSESSAARRFSNIPLARKIEALILTAVTVIASMSVDWSSLTATAESGNTLNSSWETIDESNPTIIYQFTASQNEAATPYDAVMAAYVNLQVTDGSADFYVDVYQNYHDTDFVANYQSYTNDSCAINNGKGKDSHYVTGSVNSTIFGSSRVMSLWNVNDVSQSPVIVKYGENAAIVVTFYNITSGTTIQYGQGVNEFNETYPIELKTTPVAEDAFSDGTTLNGSTTPFVLMSDGSAVSYDRFTLSPAYERKINYSVGDSSLVDIDTTNKLLSPINGQPGATTLTVSAAGANSLTIPVKVVSKGSVATSKVYNGQPVAGVAPYCGTTLTEGQDYTVLYNGQAKSATADVGNYTATVTGISDSGYEGLSYTQDFTVTPKSLNDGSGNWNSTLVFTPSAVVIDPATPAVYSAADCLYDTESGLTLVQNKDFTIGTVARVSGSLKDYQVTFNGKGNYEGSSVTAEITGANTTEGYIDLSTMVQDIQIVDQVTSKAAVYIFNGNGHSVALKLLDAGGQELPLVQGTDYDFTIVDISDPTKVIYDSSTGSGGVTNAGTYKVIVTGKQKADGSGTGYIGSVDSYALSKKVTFTVSPLSLTALNFVAQIPSDQKLFFYDGVTGDSPHPDHLNAYYPYKDASNADATYGMVEGTDFTVEYETYSANQSSYSFTLTGKGNFTGAVNFGDIHDKSLINPKSDVYFQIIDSLDAATVTLTYENNTATTSKTADWTREASASDFAPTYTGSPIKPTVSITIGSQTLTQDDGTNSKTADYKVVYTSNNCTKAGQASLVIQGENNYSKQNHAMVVYFTIAPQPLAADALQTNVQEDAKVYAMGKELTLTYASGSSSEYFILDPANTKNRLILARATADEIAKGDDYVASQYPNAAYYVTYNNNVNAGDDAEIIAHGINNYSGTSTANFTITPMEIKAGNGFSVAALPDMTYTGSDITIPDSDIIVKYVQFTSPVVLENGTDYYVTYENNRNVTTNASMIVHGQGNFKGTITVPFKIVNQSISDKSIQYIIGRNKTEKDYKVLGPTNNTDVTIEYTGTKANGTSLPVKLRKGTNNELTVGTDYKVIYPDEVSVGQHSLIISGAGIYAGSSAYISYWVTERDIANVSNLRLVSITSSAAIDTTTKQVKTNAGILVTGTDIKRYYQVVSGNGQAFPAEDANGNTNYTYTWQTSDGTDAGTVPTTAGTGYKVVLTGSGNYTGSVTLDKSYATTSLSSSQQPLMVGASLDVNNIIKVYGAGGEVNGQHSLGYLGNNMPAADISGSNNAKLTDNTTLNSNIDGDTSLSTLSGPTYSAGTYDNTGATDYTVHFISTDGSTEYTTFMEPGTIFKVRVDAKEGSTKYFGSHTTSNTFKVTPGNLTALQKSSGDVKTQVTVKDTNTTNASKTTYVVSGGADVASHSSLSYEYTGGDIAPSLSVVIEPSYNGFNGTLNSIDLANYGKTQTPATISGSAVTASGSNPTIAVSAARAATGNTSYFTGSVDVPYAVTAYELQPTDITLGTLSLTYDGTSHEEAIKKAVHVKVKGATLDSSKYTVEFYTDSDCNTKADDSTNKGFTNAGNIYVKITAISDKSIALPTDGNGVTASGNFTIAPRNLSNVTFTPADKSSGTAVAMSQKEGVYAIAYSSNMSAAGNITALASDSVTITENDYTITPPTTLVLGANTISIEGTGNYTGSRLVNFYIYGQLSDSSSMTNRFKADTDLKDGDTFTLNANGQAVNDQTSAIFDARGITFESPDSNASVYLSGSDLDVTIIDPDRNITTTMATPGKKKITFKGRGVTQKCDTTSSQSFTVTVYGDAQNFTIKGLATDYDFKGDTNGKGVDPVDHSKLSVQLNGSTVPASAYTLTVEPADGASSEFLPKSGTTDDAFVKVEINSTNNTTYYKNSGAAKTQYFNIRYNLKNAVISSSQTEAFTMDQNLEDIKNTITVTLQNKTLTADTDYTLDAAWTSSGNNQAQGSATLTITASPDANKELSYNFVTKKYAGNKKQITDSMVTWPSELTAEYDGNDHKADFSAVTIDGLTEGTDYTISWMKVDDSGNETAVSASAAIKDAGKYKAYINGVGDYYADPRPSKEFTITARDLSNSTMALVDENVKYYSGADPDAKYTVTDNILGELTEKTDYTIKRTTPAEGATSDWAVNTSVTYTVTGTGNFKGSISDTFTIDEADLTVDGVITVSNDSVEYDGQAHGPEFQVYRGTKLLEKDKDYTLDKNDASVNVGTYTYTITGDGNYTGSKTIDFKITPRDLSKATFELKAQKHAWTGAQVKPEYTVADTVSGTSIIKDSDYTVSYANNIDSYKLVDDDTTDASAPAVVFTADASGNYTGTVTRHFQIGSDIADATVELDKEERDFDSKTPFYPAVESVSVTNGPKYDSTSTPKVSEVAENPTYEFYNSSTNEWTAVTQPLAAGTYRAVVAGKGPFFGTNSKAEFTIIPNSVSSRDLQVTIKKDTKSGQHYDSGKDIYYYYYTGEEIKPDVVVKYKNPDTGKLYTLNPSDSDEDITGDYYLTYEDNIRVGTAAVVVHLHNNYESDGGADGDASFEIRARDVSKYKVRVKGGDVAYTGDELKPDYIVTASDGTKYDSSNESDAEVLDALGLTAEYTNNVGPGTGNITITGSGNSSGTTATATFTIYADISKDVDYITPKEVFRTGSSLSPDITLHIVDNAGTDHPVASSSNWFRTTFTPEDGTWATATKLTVSVSHRGNYLIGRKNFTVNLSAVPPNLTIDGYQPTYQYTGTKINPSGLTVKSDGEALPSGATVSFSFNSARDGSACVLPGKVTITATVSYGGQSATVTAGKYSTEDNEKPATFTIVPRPIKACVFQGPSDSRYTGSAISPIFSINTGYAQLRNGTDYTYTVRNNVKPGNAIVTITGRGNYIGTTTKAFHIYVAPVTGLSTSNKSGTTAVVRWRRSGTADGYRVTYTSSTGVRKMLITSPTASNYKLTDLKSGTTQVLVEAYVSSASGRPMAYSAPASVTVR